MPGDAQTDGQTLAAWAGRWPEPWSGPALRHDVLVFAAENESIEVFDPLRDKVFQFSPLEVQQMRAGVDPGQRLANDGLVDDARAVALRTAAWRIKRDGGKAIVAFDAAPTPSADTFDLAETLPEGRVGDAWRDPERWRRLAVTHRGGGRYLQLPGLIDPTAAVELASAVRALPSVLLKTDLLTARRCLVDVHQHLALRPWLEFIASPALRHLVGAVLARDIPGGLVVNAWRLQQHDFMGVHPDGRFYRGTFSIGLNANWEAADGGAIAFGTPSPDGFQVAERWYPHLGDALLFAPDGDTWHAVEPVRTQKVRLSLTGWWVDPEHALSNKEHP